MYYYDLPMLFELAFECSVMGHVQVRKQYLLDKALASIHQLH